MGMSRSAAHPPPSPPPPPLAIVVTADDFGIGVRTSAGIIEAHRRGPVTATSVMVITGRHVEESIPLLHDAPELDVGLHVALTRCGHRPLVASRASGLVDRSGDFLSNRRLWLAAFSGRISQLAVEEEIAAQAELFGKLLGRKPAHVDAHHHAHQLPGLREALIAVIGRGLLPPVTRTTRQPPAMPRGAAGAKLRRCAAHWIGKRAAKIFAQHHIRSNDYFFGMLGPRDLRQDFPWRNYLMNLPPSGVVEWVVHPGFDDETLVGRDGYRAGRAKELQSLTQPQTAAAWEPLRRYLSRKSVLYPQ